MRSIKAGGPKRINKYGGCCFMRSIKAGGPERIK
jgi:hypothetical protein